MTPTPRHLDNAPLIEALIDIQVQFDPATSDKVLDSLKSLSDELKTEYPDVRERRVEEFVHIREKGERDSDIKHTAGVVGYIGHNKQNTYVVQLINDRFTFSRLNPYESWEALRNEAHRLWLRYRSVIAPVVVSRVAVRYINRLPLPFPLDDFGEYLSKPPEVPEGLPQGLASFLTRLVIPDPDTKAVAIVHQSLPGLDKPKDPPLPATVPVTLDIDVFKVVELKADSPQVWELLEELRALKNRIFFASITDQTMDLFQ